jgi:hypothetical protein
MGTCMVLVLLVHVYLLGYARWPSLEPEERAERELWRGLHPDGQHISAHERTTHIASCIALLALRQSERSL